VAHESANKIQIPFSFPFKYIYKVKLIFKNL